MISGGRRGALLAALLAPLALATALVATPAAAAGTASIAGFVSDLDGSPISEVCVSAYEPGADIPAGTACTDPIGNFTIPDLTDGTSYELFADGSGSGYGSVWYPRVPDRAAATAVPAPSSSLWFILFPAQGSPSVSGTVWKADGTPAAAVSVHLWTTGGLAASTSTDSSGSWSLTVGPGDYTVGYTQDFTFSWFWHGRRDAESADPVHIGDAPVVLDETVPDRTTVTGTIRNAAGTPVDGICVLAADPADPATRYGEACADATGTYRLTDIPAGTWQIQSVDYTGAYAPISSDPITIADGQTIAGVDLIVAVAGSLNGTVVDRNTGAPLADVCPSAYDGRAEAYLPAQVITCSDAAGRWTIKGLAAGRVSVRLGEDPTHQARWAADADSQADATLYRIEPGAATSTGTVRLYRGATLTGMIKATDGTPLADAWVTLSTEYNARAGAGEERWSARTDTAGRYTITNAPLGKRPALVYSSGPTYYAWQYSGPATDPARAAKLDLRSGATTTFNTKLAPQGLLKVKVTGAADDAYSSIDAFTVPSQAIIGYGGEASGNGTATVAGLPTSSVKVRVQVLDQQSQTTRTTWYGGATFAKATPVVVRQGATTTITVEAP